MKKALVVAAIATAAGLGMTGCANAGSGDEQVVISIDGPEYGSVEELAAAADLVVKGHFTGDGSPISEGELNGVEPGGLPMELWSFVVDEVVAGDASLSGTTIQVSQLAVDADGAVRPAGDNLSAMLFLRPYPSDAYAIVGLGAGTIYVDEEGGLSVPDGVSTALEIAVADESSESIDATIIESSE